MLVSSALSYASLSEQHVHLSHLTESRSAFVPHSNISEMGCVQQPGKAGIEAWLWLYMTELMGILMVHRQTISRL